MSTLKQYSMVAGICACLTVAMAVAARDWTGTAASAGAAAPQAQPAPAPPANVASAPAPAVAPPTVVAAAAPASSSAAAAPVSAAAAPAPATGGAVQPLTWADPKPGTVADPKTGLPEEVIDRRTGIELVLIAAGTYRRGSEPGNWTERDEMPAHEVTLTKPFYVGRMEVSQGQWARIMGTNPSDHRKGAEFPVENVSLAMVTRFLQATGFRLPTEAEWEYGCKAGGPEPITTAANPMEALTPIAWFDGNSGGSTQPVGHPSKQGNGFGLHDLLGNVSEWTATNYDVAEYPRSIPSVTDPAGPSEGREVVVRGCNARAGWQHCRCSARWHATPNTQSGWLGFRVARDAA